MQFYALVIWRTRGVLPAMLQLVYLGNGEMLRYEPDEADLLATERKVEAIWAGDRAGPRDAATGSRTGRLLRLVLLPGALPGVRRHSPAAARAALGIWPIEQGTERGHVEPGQRVPEVPPPAGEDGHVVRHDQHRAAGRLGGAGAGVGVLDGHGSRAGSTPSSARRLEVGLRVRLADGRPRPR